MHEVHVLSDKSVKYHSRKMKEMRVRDTSLAQSRSIELKFSSTKRPFLLLSRRCPSGAEENKDAASFLINGETYSNYSS